MAPGARRKFGAPMFEPEVFYPEANLLYWRKCLWYCLDFSASPAVIRRPNSNSAPEELRSFSPLVTPLLLLQLFFSIKTCVSVPVLRYLACLRSYLATIKQSLTSLAEVLQSNYSTTQRVLPCAFLGCEFHVSVTEHTGER